MKRRVTSVLPGYVFFCTCGKRMQVPLSQAGLAVTCDHCRNCTYAPPLSTLCQFPGTEVFLKTIGGEPIGFRFRLVDLFVITLFYAYATYLSRHLSTQVVIAVIIGALSAGAAAVVVMRKLTETLKKQR